MKFWQAISMVDIDELPAIVKKAEELGFEGVILSDHLMTFGKQADFYEGSQDGQIIWSSDTHWPDPWVLIGALSQITTTLKFLTAVYVLPMRDPFTSAKAISTAAILSNNRVALGVGLGWQEAEFNAVGQSFHNRGRRTDEILKIFKRLSLGEMMEHSGEFYRFGRLNMSPGVSQPVPIYIGGLSSAALKRAARNDGWIGAQHDIPELKEMIKSLFAERRSLERADDDAFEVIASIKAPDIDKYFEAKSIGVTKIIKNSWLTEEGKLSRIPLQDKLEDMEDFAARYIENSAFT